MRQGERRPVIIVGAGPVGLVCALRLARVGIPSILLEMEETFAPDLRATTFHPPTLDMLGELDITPALMELGVVVPEWQILHMQTGERAIFDLSVIKETTSHPFRLQCEQYKLGHVLMQAVRNEPLVEVRLGHKVAAITQNEDGVTAAIDGGPGAISGSFLIGADGAHSMVRRSLALPLQGSTYPSETILTTTSFEFDKVIPELLGANYVWGIVDSYSMFRLREEWRCTFYPRPGDTDETGVSQDVVQERLQHVYPKGDAYELGECRAYRIHQRIVPRYHVGRVVLAGDSAHLNAPTGGMGMNGGIHDAVNLTEKLARVWKGESLDLLDLYSRQRHPVAKDEIIKQAHQNRLRMQQRDLDAQIDSLRELQAVAADPERCYAHLLKTSMITGLRRAEAIA